MYREDEVEELLIKYKPYIKSIVNRFKVNQFDKEDLFQAGLVGLFKAISHYDEKVGVKLSTYAFKYILGSVSKEYAKLNVYGKKEYNKIREYVNLNKHKSTDELISDLNISKEIFFEAMSLIDKVVYLTDDNIDLIKDKSKTYDEILTDEEHLIIKYYVDYKYNQTKIAKLLNTSQASISRKIKQITIKLKNRA